MTDHITELDLEKTEILTRLWGTYQASWMWDKKYSEPFHTSSTTAAALWSARLSLIPKSSVVGHNSVSLLFQAPLFQKSPALSSNMDKIDHGC